MWDKLFFFLASVLVGAVIGGSVVAVFYFSVRLLYG